MAFTDNVGQQISGSPSLGAEGTSSYVLPSSPVTDPQPPGNGRSIFDPSLDGSGIIENDTGMVGLFLVFMAALLV